MSNKGITPEVYLEVVKEREQLRKRLREINITHKSSIYMIKKEAEEMINIEVKEEQTEEKPEYPKFMIERNGSGLIVEFSDLGKGYVIVPGETEWERHEYYNGWDMDEFKLFHGTITLSNQG